MDEPDNTDRFAEAVKGGIRPNIPDDVRLTPESYLHFSKLPTWHALEFMMLAVDRNPHEIPLPKITQHIEYYDFKEPLALALDIMRRQEMQMKISPDRAPKEWIAWADEWEIDVPPALVVAVKEREERRVQRASARLAEKDGCPGVGVRPPIDFMPSGITYVDAYYDEALQRTAQKPKETNPSAETRERESLLKLVIGMAIKGYTFDPKSNRSPVIKEIASDLQLLGLGLSDDTIRKHLRAGAELLSLADDE